MKRTLTPPSRVLVWALLAGAPLACTPYASEDDAGTTSSSSSSSGGVLPDAGSITDASVPDSAVNPPPDAGPPDSGPVGPRATARQYFVDNVFPVFQAQACVACHSGTMAVPFLSTVVTPTALDAYAAVRAARAVNAPFTGQQLVNLTQPPLSVILNKGSHLSMAGPPFGRNALDLQRFITWCGLEKDAAIFEGTYVPVYFDAGVPDAAQPADAGASVPDAAMFDDAGVSTVNPLPDAGPSNMPTTDPYGGMVHHNLTPPLSPEDVVSLLNQEGPPEYSMRVHGCSKLSYVALGNVLQSRGMSLGGSAGSIYQSKTEALGAANFVKGVPEAKQLSTAGAAKFLDIVLEAAGEVVAGIASASACADPEGLGGSVGGQARLFNDTACGAGMPGCCLESGVSCLLGLPASVDHLAICDAVVSSTLNNNGQSLDPTLGKVVAVGTLLAASYVCE